MVEKYLFALCVAPTGTTDFERIGGLPLYESEDLAYDAMDGQRDLIQRRGEHCEFAVGKVFAKVEDSAPRRPDHQPSDEGKYYAYQIISDVKIWI